jgi:hypothetical protein
MNEKKPVYCKVLRSESAPFIVMDVATSSFLVTYFSITLGFKGQGKNDAKFMNLCLKHGAEVFSK